MPVPSDQKISDDFQIRDGKVLTQRGVIDNVPALRRLGAVPSPRS
jgi:hypothetical protein